MKRIATLFAVAGLALIGMGINAGPASASKPGEDEIELPNGTHVKVDICHWANGHPHLVPVSISATAQPQEVQHGTLVIDEDIDFVSFVAHDTNGHEQDFVVRIYTKHGNDETSTYVSERECEEDEPTTTTTQPPTTTTTEPPVTTTTTEPPVVTTTTQPSVVVTPPATDTPVPPAPDAPVVNTPDAPAVATPIAAPVDGELASTGSFAQMLALIGAGIGLLGLSLLLGFRRSGAMA